MKKVFLSLAVVFSVALVSCGGHKAAEEAQEDAAPVEEVVADAAVVEDTVAPDSVVTDTVVVAEAVQAPAAE